MCRPSIWLLGLFLHGEDGMAETTRLPVQHRGAPHCPRCKKDLPTYDDLTMMLPVAGDGEPTIVRVSVHMHVVCSCGLELELVKETSGH